MSVGSRCWQGRAELQSEDFGLFLSEQLTFVRIKSVKCHGLIKGGTDFWHPISCATLIKKSRWICRLSSLLVLVLPVRREGKWDRRWLSRCLVPLMTELNPLRKYIGCDWCLWSFEARMYARCAYSYIYCTWKKCEIWPDFFPQIIMQITLCWTRINYNSGKNTTKQHSFP